MCWLERSSTPVSEEPQSHLDQGSGSWVTNRDIPEANWKHNNISEDPILNGRHPRIEAGSIYFEEFLLIADTRTLLATIKYSYSLHNVAHT